MFFLSIRLATLRFGWKMFRWLVASWSKLLREQKTRKTNSPMMFRFLWGGNCFSHDGNHYAHGDWTEQLTIVTTESQMFQLPRERPGPSPFAFVVFTVEWRRPPVLLRLSPFICFRHFFQYGSAALLSLSLSHSLSFYSSIYLSFLTGFLVFGL